MKNRKGIKNPGTPGLGAVAIALFEVAGQLSRIASAKESLALTVDHQLDIAREQLDLHRQEVAMKEEVRAELMAALPNASLVDFGEGAPDAVEACREEEDEVGVLQDILGRYRVSIPRFAAAVRGHAGRCPLCFARGGEVHQEGCPATLVIGAWLDDPANAGQVIQS